MGLRVHALADIPAEAQRSYWVYLLNYGWKDSLTKTVDEHLDKLVEVAGRYNAVVVTGTGQHVDNEVMSWHGVDGVSGSDVFPAILITTRNPHDFLRGVLSDDETRVVMFPLNDACKSPDEVVSLLRRICGCIRDRRPLADFEVKESISGRVFRSIVAKPTIGGIGVDLKELLSRST